MTDLIFAPTSFWYQPIPVDAPLHANSAGFVADFLRQIKAYYGIVAAYGGVPVYTVPPDAPTTDISPWNDKALDPGLIQQWAKVPMPAYAIPDPGIDAEMVIYQPSTCTLWEFWKTVITTSGWNARWGGRLQPVCKSDGIWPYPYGATATGLPLIGGQITAEELQRGEIRHAIGIVLVDLEDKNVVSWPANRSDGSNPSKLPNRIPEGTRFRLDPAVNLDAIALHPIAKTVARAAQKYGFVVWDKAGAIVLRLQHPSSYTALGQPDPYPALLNGAHYYAVFNNFPWDRLQFLPKDYGKP